MEPHSPNTMSQEQSFPSPEPEGHIQDGSNRRSEGEGKNEVGLEKEARERMSYWMSLRLTLCKFVTRQAK